MPVPTFPSASLAVHVTVVFPSENIDPDAGLQFGQDVTQTLSVAVGFAKFTIVPCVLVV